MRRAPAATARRAVARRGAAGATGAAGAAGVTGAAGGRGRGRRRAGASGDAGRGGAAGGTAGQRRRAGVSGGAGYRRSRRRRGQRRACRRRRPRRRRGRRGQRRPGRRGGRWRRQRRKRRARRRGGHAADSGGLANVAVYVAGDSTVQTYTGSTIHQGGWGQFLDDYFTTQVTVNNRAIGGRTSRRFIEEGRLTTILSTIRAGDYLFVQFGTNDSNRTATYDDGEPYYLAPDTDFKTWMQMYIDAAKSKNAIPVLVTPPPRNSCRTDGVSFNYSFTAYATAMKELGQTNSVAVDRSGRGGGHLPQRQDRLRLGERELLPGARRRHRRRHALSGDGREHPRQPGRRRRRHPRPAPRRLSPLTAARGKVVTVQSCRRGNGRAGPASSISCDVWHWLACSWFSEARVAPPRSPARRTWAALRAAEAVALPVVLPALPVVLPALPVVLPARWSAAPPVVLLAPPAPALVPPAPTVVPARRDRISPMS